LAGAHSSLILSKLNPPHIEALYATEIQVKYFNFIIIILFFSFSTLAQQKQYEIDELKTQEVVLTEIAFLYTLDQIRKSAFNEKAFETIDKIDKTIFLSITDNLIYQPQFTKQHAGQVLEFLNDIQYYPFTWSTNSNDKLLRLLGSIKR